MFELLNSLGIDTSGFDRWGLHWAGAEQTWTWFSALLLIVAFVALSIPGTKPAHTRGRRAALLALRFFSLLVLLWCLFQPAVRLSQVARMENSLAVLIDASESMGIANPESGRTRLEEALDFIAHNSRFFDRLEQDYQVSYYAFDQTLKPLAGRPGQDTLTAHGQATEILESLTGLARETSTRTLAGVLLLSDGGDNGMLRSIIQAMRNKEGQGAQEEISSLLRDFQGRINAVVCGMSEAFRDLAIVDVVHDEYGFVHNPFGVVVKLRADGDLASEVPLTFKREGEVIATRQVKVSGSGIVEVKLDFTPRQVGEFFFTVEIPVYAGEASDRNNMVRFPLKVLRDEVRVLYIVGNPSWDERFLRETMKKNPSVDLVSFYILRERWDPTEAPQNEVSLIPFPTQELFTKELENFDLVIFQNFYGHEYMLPEYMRLLRNYVVERGGALLVIGGIRGFLGGTVFNQPLEEILPVELTLDIPNWEEGEYRMELTPTGRAHPVMRLLDNEEENARLWASLPTLEGINRTLRAKPAALVLGVHPFLKGPAGNLPVLALWESGAGRVMTVATDSTWRWHFLAVGEGKTARYYQLFWDNALRWLLKDPEMQQLSLTVDKRKVNLGETVKLMLEVLDESYKPASAAQVQLEVSTKPEGSELALPEGKPAGAGKYAYELTPDVPGAYRIKAQASQGGRSLGQAEVIFEVAMNNREFEDVSVRPDILQALSAAKAGVTIQAAESVKALQFPNPVVEKVTGIKDLPLWDNAIVYALALGSLGTLWFLRRRWGMS